MNGSMLKTKFTQNPDILVKIVDHIWNTDFYRGIGRRKKCKHFKIEYFMPCGAIKLKNTDNSLSCKIAKGGDIEIVHLEKHKG